jgi:hypothetical protein
MKPGHFENAVAALNSVAEIARANMKCAARGYQAKEWSEEHFKDLELEMREAVAVLEKAARRTEDGGPLTEEAGPKTEEERGT